MSDDKQVRRAALKARRKAAALADPAAGAGLAAAFWASPLSGEAGPVSGYWPIGSEVDPRPLMVGLTERGLDVCLPLIAQTPGLPLTFRRWTPNSVMEPHGFKTLAPADDGQPLMTPHMLLVPLLGFDRRGGRLGYGQGHYDRTLAVLRAHGTALAVGLAFAAQEEDQVPLEPHDVPLDWVVTERGAFCCA